MPTAAYDAREPEAPLALAGRAGRRLPLLANLSQLVGSHLVVGLTGIAALPVLARNFGAHGYGSFSLFVALLGVVSSLDFARPLLVRELSRGVVPTRAGQPGAPALAGLLTASALVFAPLAFLLGWWVGGPWTGLGLGLGVALFVLASGPFAELSAAGRVGRAGAVRNGFWTLALVAVVVLSFFLPPPHAYVWAFATANLGVLVALRRLAARELPLISRPRLLALRAHSREARDIVLFGLGAAVVVSADRLLLEHFAPGDVFGRYGAQYDLATKVNILSTALGAVLFPLLTRLVKEEGLERAATRYVRLVTWIALAYFAGLLGLLLLRDEVQHLVLGSDLAAASVYPLIVVGTFVHLFGFLVAPWQRARNDFGAQRRAYGVAAILTIVAGLLLIPRYGAPGAAATYLVARSAELLLIAQTFRELGPAHLGRRHAVGLLLLISLLTAAAVSGGVG